MRAAGTWLALGAILLCQGCLAVTAGSLAVSTVETAGKATVAVADTTGRLAASTVHSSRGMSIQAAAKLSQPEAVVAVDAKSGRRVTFGWQPGLDLRSVAGTNRLGGKFRSARIFRQGTVETTDLRAGPAGATVLQPGDVIELHR